MKGTTRAAREAMKREGLNPVVLIVVGVGIVAVILVVALALL